MDDITLGPLLNAAALANDGIEQLIQSPAAAESDLSSAKKKAAKKKPTISNNVANFLKHPDSDAHKLQTNQLLLETASRIEDAIAELEAYADILSADGSVLQHRKDNKRSAAANNIRSSILPLLQITANTLRDAGKCFAPYSGTERLQERSDVDRKRKFMRDSIVNDNDKSLELLMIEDFVKKSNWSPSDEFGKSSSSLYAKKKRKSASTASSIPSTNSYSVTLLKPQNGSTYTKAEAIAMIKQHKKRSRGRIYQAMIQKGFVPVSQHSLIRLMRKVENGDVILESEWEKGRGRPRSIWLDPSTKPKPVDCNLTFDDLDTGDNRIVVEVPKEKKQKTEEWHDDDDEGEEEGEGEEEDDNEHASTSAESATKQSHQKQQSPPEQDKKPRARAIPKAKKRLSPKLAAKIASIEVPPPRDGKEYTKSEFVEVRPFIPTKQHMTAMRAMIHKGYVGTVSEFTLRRLIKKDLKGEPIIDSAWTSGSGRPPKASFDEVNEIVDKIKQDDLRIYDDEDVKELLLEVMMKRGEVDEAKLRLSGATVSHYFAMLKSKLSPLYWKRLEDE